MKRKVLLGTLGAFVVIALAWGLNIGVRTAQFISQELNPMWRMNQGDPVEDCGRGGVRELSRLNWGVRHGGALPFDEAFPSGLDLDGDGLNALEEIFKLTSDGTLDSDNDGIPDPEDRCIDCRMLSYRDRLETLLVSKIICEWGSGKDRVYVLSSNSVDPSSACPETTFVSAPAWAVEYLVRQPEAWGTERNPDWGRLKVEPRLYAPGLIYGYYIDYYCGPLCAESSYAFVLDIPIVGPVYLGRRVLWIS